MSKWDLRLELRKSGRMPFIARATTALRGCASPLRCFPVPRGTTAGVGCEEQARFPSSNAQRAARGQPGTIATAPSVEVATFARTNLGSAEISHQASKGILDFTHTIDGLSFGPKFPGLVDVLDGRVKMDHVGEGTEHYQYDVHVIPTRYTRDWNEIVGAQYSVTEYKKSIYPKERQAELVAAGLYLSYDFTPFEVKVSVERKKLSHFLTECCAILGGIFAFSGMLDSMAYRASKIVARRIAPAGQVQIPTD